MANHKSAIKRHRQSLKRNAANKSIKTRVRTAIKAARAAITAKEANAEELLRTAERELAKAANKRVFHKGNAARRTSRLRSLMSTKAA